MHHFSLLLMVSASLFWAGCETDSLDGSSSEKSDQEVIIPNIAGNYGFVVKGALRMCKAKVGGTEATCVDEERLSLWLTIHGLAEMTQDDNTVSASYSFCKMSLTRLNGDEYTDSGNMYTQISNFGTIGTFEGILDSNEQGFSLQSDALAMQLGLNLKNPLTDSLPKNSTDAGAIDQDKDEKAGIELGNWSSGASLGYRWIGRMSLAIEDSGILRGELVRERSDAIVFDTSGLAPSVQDLNKTIEALTIVNEAHLNVGALDEGYRIRLLPNVSNCGEVKKQLSMKKWWLDLAEKWWIQGES